MVFGSVARGDARPDSDIDILIVGRGLPRSRFRRQELLKRLKRKLRSYVASNVVKLYTELTGEHIS